ncbi:hypothetical protein HY493_04435 [Candidatus Woesearchaeota archaeon]|nr:hypothetical protein [Candidatus Woesearchaeota archaeon]
MVRILAGCPTSEHKAYCLQEYAAGIKGLKGGFDVLLVDNSGNDDYIEKIRAAGLQVVKGPFLEHARDRIVASRNMLRKKALDEGYDWFFSLEQDVIPQPDALRRLLKPGKEIVSGIYTKNYILEKDGKEVGRKELPLVWVFDGKVRQLEMAELEPGRVIQAVLTGLGCILIHRTVLEKVEFRWDPGHKGFDDAFFCHDAQKAGFKLWADTGIRCQHLEMDWEGIKK